MKWNGKTNKKYTLIAIYVIITSVIIYSIIKIIQNAPNILVIIMDNLKWLAEVATPILYAFIIAYLLDPVINFFEKQLLKIKIGKDKRQLKSCRTLSVFITIIILFAILIGIISLLVFSITNQLRLANFDDILIIAKSFIASINEFYYSLINKLNELNIQSDILTNYVKYVGSNFTSILDNYGNSFMTSITNITSGLTTFLFSFIIGIYFMIDGALIKEFINKVSNALFNDKWNNQIRIFLNDADKVFSGYIRGQLSDALVMVFLISITLSIIGVKFAIIIGILAGIGNLIPYVGPVVAYICTGIVCLVNGQFHQLIIAIIALVVVQAIDGNIIAPKLLSHSIQIHPVLVIISLIFGSAIGGLVGMLLAVPVGALIKLLFVRFIDMRLEKKELKKIIEESDGNTIDKE